MQAVQRIKREKRMDGGKKKEEVDDPHTSAAKRKRPLRNGAELLPCGAAFLLLRCCLYSTLLSQARAVAGTALARVTGVSPLRGSLGAAYRSIIVS